MKTFVIYHSTRIFTHQSSPALENNLTFRYIYYTMKFKSGVICANLHPAIEHALNIIDYTWRDIANKHAVVTSLQDGTHSEGSLHYGIPGDTRCRAVDIRTNDSTRELMDRLIQNLRVMLGDAYDIVLEDTHLHIEYDPY